MGLMIMTKELMPLQKINWPRAHAPVFAERKPLLFEKDFMVSIY